MTRRSPSSTQAGACSIPSNYGLALALAGRTAEAIAVLEPAAREHGRRRHGPPEPRAGPCLCRRLGQCPHHRRAGRSRRPARCAHPSVDAARLAEHAGRPGRGAGRRHPAAVDQGQPVRLALASPIRKRGANRRRPRGCRPSEPLRLRARSQRRFAAASPPASQRRPPAPARRRHRSPLSAGSAAASARRSPHWHRARGRGARRRSLRFGHAAQPSAGRQAGKAACRRCRRPAAAIRRAVVQLGAYGSPQRVLAAWNGDRSEVSRAQGLFADERPLRQRRRAPSTACRSSGFGSDARGARAAACRCSARAAAASSATSRATRRSSIASR